MSVRFAKGSDYFAFRHLLYAQWAEEDETWESSPETKMGSRYTLDRYLKQLVGSNEVLLLFEADDVVFGYGWTKVISGRLVIYSAYFRPEYYDSFSALELGLDIGRCLGKVPYSIMFDCNKANLVLKSNRDAGEDKRILSEAASKQRLEIALDVEKLGLIFGLIRNQERLDSNSHMENVLHGPGSPRLSDLSIKRIERVLEELHRG